MKSTVKRKKVTDLKDQDDQSDADVRIPSHTV